VAAWGLDPFILGRKQVLLLNLELNSVTLVHSSDGRRMRLKYVVDLGIHLLQIQIDCYKDNWNIDIILNSLKLFFWY
jgi:hypothetical protein